MNVYITRTYGLEGTAAKAQSMVVKEAKKLGIKEIRIPIYYMKQKKCPKELMVF